MIEYKEPINYGGPDDFPSGSRIIVLITDVTEHQNPRTFYRVVGNVIQLNGKPYDEDKQMSITFGNQASPNTVLGKLITQVWGKAFLEERRLSDVTHFKGKRISLIITGYVTKPNKDGELVQYPTYDFPVDNTRQTPLPHEDDTDYTEYIQPDKTTDTVTVSEGEACDYCDKPITGMKLHYQEDGITYVFCGPKCQVKFRKDARGE